MSITTQVKDAMMTALRELPATSNGTEIQAVVGSGEDAFDEYPVIRVVPSGIERTVSSDTMYRDYQINIVVSVYLDMGDAEFPDEEVIDTMCEIQDEIFDALDDDDWLPDVQGLVLAESASTTTLDTIATKNGTALYCDIVYPIAYRTNVA